MSNCLLIAKTKVSHYIHYLIKNFARQSVRSGDSIRMKRDSTLVTPPKKEDGSGYYDSVNGETGSSQVYIVYDHDKSYPAYLITFQ